MSQLPGFDQDEMLRTAQRQQTGRESYHWDRIPDAYRNIPGITDWANDPNIDPGAKVQDYLSSQRAAGRTDEGDAAALTGQGYLGGQAPTSPRTNALNQLSSVYNSSSVVSPTTDRARGVLFDQLAGMSQAPTVNDPGIREVLAGQRLALQRSAERQQAQGAAQRATMGLSRSGFADTSRLGIEQARGEAEARGVGDVLGGELDARRRQLAVYLQLAMASGDAESERLIRQELAQMQQGQFNDQLGYQYNALNQNANLQALLGLLNAA